MLLLFWVMLTRPRIAALSLAATITACAPGATGEMPDEGGDLAIIDNEEIIAGNRITAEWFEDGDVYVSEPLSTSNGRLVSALVHGAEGLDLEIHVQAMDAEGQPEGDWIPLEYDWSESGISILLYTFDETKRSVRLRIPSANIEMVSRLQWTFTGTGVSLETPDEDVRGSTSAVGATTVSNVAARRACSTAGVEGISRQLAEMQACLRPGGFVRFDDHPNITVTSSRVHPYLQSRARSALHRAADSGTIRINSAFRTVADQYVLYHSGACGAAASPGSSNHQDGRAVDVQNWSERRTALTDQGCRWFGAGDEVHFTCPGSDLRSDAVYAFQRLWNLNNPGDRLSEDGRYGPATASRLGRTPASGFAVTGCDATPAPTPEPEEPPAAGSGEFFYPGMIRRSAWGAAPSRRGYTTHRPVTITIHHTAGHSENPEGQVRGIQRSHFGRGFSDIGYHFLIDRAGTVYEGRPPTVMGAHVLGANTGKVGISFIGCFDDDNRDCRSFENADQRQITDEAICAAGQLVNALRRHFPTIRTITRHSDHAAGRVCPGGNVEARMGQISDISLGASCGITMPGGAEPEGEPGPEETPSAGRRCEHSFGGTYGHQGCSRSYQCCDGRWTHRGDSGCGECSCEEPTGRTGCAGEGAAALPREDSCSDSDGTVFPTGACSEVAQCCEGSWSTRGACGECTEGTGVTSSEPEAPEGESCVHSYDGEYANTACSASWQCCDGSWVRRDGSSTCGECLCEEPTGEVGCGRRAETSGGGGGSCEEVNAGIDQGTGQIPRVGLNNRTMDRVRNHPLRELYGTVQSDDDGTWVAGLVSHFGGPSDRGVGPSETVAITGEIARQLNNPENPTPEQALANAENYYYIAMRWDYTNAGRSFWRSARILLKNPSNGNMVVVRPADWGPNIRTRRVLDISPQAIDDLGAVTDETILVAFAAPGTPLGPLECDDGCSAHTDCLDCTRDAECGWSVSEGACQSRDEASEDWSSDSDICAPCEMLDNCGGCVRNGHCGWCGDVCVSYGDPDFDAMCGADYASNPFECGG